MHSLFGSMTQAFSNPYLVTRILSEIFVACSYMGASVLRWSIVVTIKYVLIRLSFILHINSSILHRFYQHRLTFISAWIFCCKVNIWIVNFAREKSVHFQLKNGCSCEGVEVLERENVSTCEVLESPTPRGQSPVVGGLKWWLSRGCKRPFHREAQIWVKQYLA